MSQPEPDVHESVQTRAAHGHRSTLFTQGIRLLCKVASVLIVARLVAPSDHGLFAMAASFSLLLWMFRDLGLGTAAIQAASLSDGQCAAIFRAQLRIGILLTAATAAAGPLVARFYHQPQLTLLLLSISPGFFFIGLAGLPRVLLTRSLRYDTINRIETISAVTSTASMIGAAALGAGAYSFALFQVMAELIWAVLAWKYQPWRQPVGTAREDLSALSKTGREFTWFQALSYLSLQAEIVGVGHYLGAYALGLYSRAGQMLTLPTVHIAEPLSSVSLSALSRLAGSQTNFKKQACNSANMIAHLTLPAAAIVIALPEEVVRIVLGKNWLEAAPLLRWFGVSAAATQVTVITQSIAIAASRSSRLLTTAAFTLPVMVAAVALGLGHGPRGVAIAVATANLVLFLPRLWWRLHGSPIRVRDMLAALIGPVFTSLLIAVGAAVGRYFCPTDNLLHRLIFAAVGALLLLAPVGLVLRSLRTEWISLWQSLPIVGHATKPPSA